MPVSLNTKISFTSQERTQQQKDAEKKAVTGGGAIAATAASAKATKSGVDLFTQTPKITKNLKTVTNTAKQVKNITGKTGKLWAKVVENAKWAKDAVLNWGRKFNNTKFLKPLIKSPVFRYSAGALGYTFGLITLISGLSDIGKVTTEAVEKISD